MKATLRKPPTSAYTTFISWNNPIITKAIQEASWLKKDEQVTEIFIDTDGITVKIETKG